MKATVHKINNGSIWCVCPQQEGDLFFGMIDVDYNYIKKYAISLYNYNLIDKNFINNLKENQIIDGNLIRENRKIYFVPRDAKYSSKEEINSEPVKTRYAVTAIKAIMGNEKQRPITIEQFEYIKSIAYREGRPSDIPCHRVVSASGRTVAAWSAQRTLLEGEGVRFRPNGAVDLRSFLWRPGAPE